MAKSMIDSSGDGHGSEEGMVVTEDLETLQNVRKNLKELTGEEGPPTFTFTKEQLSLLKQTLHAPENEKELFQLLIIADYCTEDEADRVTAAIAEARRYGCSLDPIITWILNRAATNRRGLKSNRVAMLYDSLSHQKFTSNMPRRAASGNSNPRGQL